MTTEKKVEPYECGSCGQVLSGLTQLETDLLEALTEAVWRMREALVRTPRDDLTQRDALIDAIRQSDAAIDKASSSGTAPTVEDGGQAEAGHP